VLIEVLVQLEAEEQQELFLEDIGEEKVREIVSVCKDIL